MAKTAKVFLSAADGAVASYTVPDGKRALVQFAGLPPRTISIGNHSAKLFTGGVSVLGEVVVPSGATLTVTARPGDQGFIATGYEEDDA